MTGPIDSNHLRSHRLPPQKGGSKPTPASPSEAAPAGVPQLPEAAGGLELSGFSHFQQMGVMFGQNFDNVAMNAQMDRFPGQDALHAEMRPYVHTAFRQVMGQELPGASRMSGKAIDAILASMEHRHPEVFHAIHQQASDNWLDQTVGAVDISAA